MKHTLFYNCILFIVFMFFSCGEGSRSHNQDVPTAVNTKTPDPNFVKLKSFFSKDSIESLKEKPKTPITLEWAFYKDGESFNEEYQNPITPVDLIENKYGYFFIIEIGCAAGGYCSTFDLLVYSNEGRFIGRQFLGQDAGDLGFQEYFTYKSLADTILLISRATYETKEEEDKRTDSVSYRILLESSHYKDAYWEK